MIKKARDIQLGDKIGGRTIVILSRRDVKSVHPDKSMDEVRLIFADTIGRMRDDFCFVLGDTDVWVDDPPVPFPITNPVTNCEDKSPLSFSAPYLITKLAADIAVGDVVCFKIVSIDDDGLDVVACNAQGVELIYSRTEEVTCLKEGV